MKFASSWRRKMLSFVGEEEKGYKHSGFPDFAKYISRIIHYWPLLLAVLSNSSRSASSLPSKLLHSTRVCPKVPVQGYFI